MTPDAVLARFNHLRESGIGRYVAPCPAHEDRSPSLSIRVLDDGRTLLHCFAGCDVEDVVGAVGLTVGDLFSERQLSQTAIKPSPLKLRPAEALLLRGHEILAANLIVADLVTILRRGEMPSELALSRLAQCSGRIQTVRAFTEAIAQPELKSIRRGIAA